ncbi:MAG: hypothetical protein LPK12_00730 [Rhodobacterales bacterium]|nr:hypothetical protein [Rhodobacterales bacterium]MDX5498472.1 hypothetical protein [Rhodobacterales bacterium]
MRISLFVLALLAAVPAQADEISDTIRSALEAWEAGDRQFALDELIAAQQMIQSAKADDLSAFLPEAPEGWTREIKTDMNAGLAMMGGGIGAEATYEGPDGSFRITLMADNPMVASMGAMLSNAQIMASMGKVVRVGRVRFLQQDNSLQALIANRILVQAQDGDPAVMLGLLEKMDLAALEKFGG